MPRVVAEEAAPVDSGAGLGGATSSSPDPEQEAATSADTANKPTTDDRNTRYLTFQDSDMRMRPA